MVTVTILHWLIDCLWYTANEGSQLGVIQHLQISSALCPIKSSHILPEAACARQVVSHIKEDLGRKTSGARGVVGGWRRGGGGFGVGVGVRDKFHTCFQKLQRTDRSSNKTCTMQMFSQQNLCTHTVRTALLSLPYVWYKPCSHTDLYTRDSVINRSA